MLFDQIRLLKFSVWGLTVPFSWWDNSNSNSLDTQQLSSCPAIIAWHVLEIDQISTLCILGAGKTTLLNCLAGRRSVDCGEILMNDTPMSKQMRRKVSYVLQNDIFLSEISAYDTIWVSKSFNNFHPMTKRQINIGLMHQHRINVCDVVLCK